MALGLESGALGRRALGTRQAHGRAPSTWGATSSALGGRHVARTLSRDASGARARRGVRGVCAAQVRVRAGEPPPAGAGVRGRLDARRLADTGGCGRTLSLRRLVISLVAWTGRVQRRACQGPTMPATVRAMLRCHVCVLAAFVRVCAGRAGDQEQVLGQERRGAAVGLRGAQHPAVWRRVQVRHPFCLLSRGRGAVRSSSLPRSSAVLPNVVKRCDAAVRGRPGASAVCAALRACRWNRANICVQDVILGNYWIEVYGKVRVENVTTGEQDPCFVRLTPPPARGVAPSSALRGRPSAEGVLVVELHVCVQARRRRSTSSRASAT